MWCRHSRCCWQTGSFTGRICFGRLWLGQATSIRTFVETVHRLTGSRARLRFGALPYRDNEVVFLRGGHLEAACPGLEAGHSPGRWDSPYPEGEADQEKTSTPRNRPVRVSIIKRGQCETHHTLDPGIGGRPGPGQEPLDRPTLTQADFEYLGSFKTPLRVGKWSTAWSTGGLTHRYVKTNSIFLAPSMSTPAVWFTK